MCGIAGVVSGQSEQLSRLTAMLDSLVHRGPDDAGEYVDSQVALGQRRLSIIDLEGGRQPLFNEDRSLVLICNGEIYNYKELRRGLESKGHQFRTKSDCEVIVHLYEEYGADCVGYLRGMFAFAVWDSNSRELFVARDHFGQKPFYYSEATGSFAFASEIKGLLAFDDGLAEINYQALDQYLALRIIPSPNSMFARIHKLPPGHCGLLKKGVFNIWRYWDLEYEPKHGRSETQLLDDLEETMIDTLQHLVVSDVPIGAFLSGGMDSSLLVGMLTRHVCSEPLKTFSIGLPYKQFDESPHARIVADYFGTDHTERIIEPSLTKSIASLVSCLDEPSDSLSVCTNLISELASRQVKVVIGGDGGDELFGGYDRYYGNRYASQYARIPSFIRKKIIGPLLSGLPSGSWYKSKVHQLSWLHRLSFLEGGDRYAESLNYFYCDSNLRKQLYGHDASQYYAANESAESSISNPYRSAVASDEVDRMLYADSNVRMPDHSVMILDRLSMSHSLEARAPFLDHKLAEFCAKLPANLKVHGRQLRYMQRKLAERYLPKEILQRPKQGFAVALPYMLQDEYRTIFRTFLTDSKLASNGIFEQRGVDKVLYEHFEQGRDHGNRLWLLANLEVWYRMKILKTSASEITDLLTKTTALNVGS
jgi:asparagine synthase (glutamine-hydrolysing)